MHAQESSCLGHEQTQRMAKGQVTLVKNPKNPWRLATAHTGFVLTADL